MQRDLRAVISLDARPDDASETRLRWRIEAPPAPDLEVRNAAGGACFESAGILQILTAPDQAHILCRASFTMLPRTAALSLALVLATAGLAVACAPVPEEDVDGQGAAVSSTGKKETEDESPLVYVFDEKDAKDDKASPLCVGVKIADDHVLTVRGCGTGGSVIRQASKDGATKAITVSKVHSAPTPASSSTTAPSDLRVLELAGKIKGPDVRIGPLTLMDGYTVLGADTLSTDQKDAVEVKAKIESQTGPLGKLVLGKKGDQLCASDLGAPIFAKHPEPLFGFLWDVGPWVLSGMVAGESDPAEGAPSTPGAKSCTNGPWVAASVSGQLDWLKKFQPDLKTWPTPPSSTTKTPTPKAGVQSCALVTKTVPEVKTGTRTATIEAKAVFTNLTAGMARAQIGIAPKATPSNMTWTPATLAEATGARAEVRMEGGIDAPTAEGDYVVLFRASADKGLSWTECHLDSSENGASAAQALGLHVAANAPAATTPAPASDYSPNASDTHDDTRSSDDKKSSAEDDDAKTAKAGTKHAASGGCTVAPPSTLPGSSFPLAGLLLGLVALVRRRKAR
jgi:hypothetical protein